MFAIEVKELTREFNRSEGIRSQRKKIVAVDRINFMVEKGEIFGFLGPNGAGKTTTMKMLCTLLIPTAGTASLNGYDVVKQAGKIRGFINVIFGGERGLYGRLSAKENLKYFADLYGLEKSLKKERINDLLTIVGLNEHADRKVETYSRGMKQRLHIARGLINDPEIIFMDEPTIGLDPEAAHSLRRLIKGLAKKKTVFFTTHYMFEAEELCDRIALIKDGRIVLQGAPNDFKKYAGVETSIEIEGYGIDSALIDKLRGLPYVSLATSKKDNMKQVIQVQCSLKSAQIYELLNEFKDARILSVKIREPTLEDAYLRLVAGKHEEP